jgi:hypothetical protein
MRHTGPRIARRHRVVGSRESGVGSFEERLAERRGEDEDQKLSESTAMVGLKIYISSLLFVIFHVIEMLDKSQK